MHLNMQGTRQLNHEVLNKDENRQYIEGRIGHENEMGVFLHVGAAERRGIVR